MVVVASGRGSQRRVHVEPVTFVEHLSADLVSESDREIDTVETQRCVETAVEVGKCVALHFASLLRCYRIVGGRYTLLLAGRLVGLIGVPHRFTGFLVYAGIGRQVEREDRFAFGEEFGALLAAYVFSVGRRVILILHGQFDQLILVMGHVEREVPYEVFGPDQVGVQLDFDTAVDHVADVGEDGRIAGFQRGSEFEQHVGGLAVEEVDAARQTPKCKNCDVSLTYHKGINQLTCHYCGYTYQLPKSCPACEGTELVNRGFGTEKIEDDIKVLFPEAAVARMDLDTTRTRAAYEKIIADFEQGKTDILIGTQMVSKGLDFDHVSIVGILNADTMLNYPDFRSYERAFQLMAQVAGRAGRKNKRGRVVLQTKSIDHPIIHQVIGNNYEEMVDGQLAERQMFHYPPYYRLVYVYLKNHNETLLDQMAAVMADKLRTVFGNRVLGPDKPPVARIQTLFIKKIVLKIEQNAPMGRARELLQRIQKEMLEDERYKSLIVYYDVDPM